MWEGIYQTSPVRPQEIKDWNLKRGSKPQRFWQIGGEFPQNPGTRGDGKQGRGPVGPALSWIPLCSPFLPLGVSHLCWPLLGPSSPPPTHHLGGCGSGGWGLSRGQCPFPASCGMWILSPEAAFLLFSCRCPGSLGFGIFILRPACLETGPAPDAHVQALWALAQAGPLPGKPFCPSSLGAPRKDPIQAPTSSALPSGRGFTSRPSVLLGFIRKRRVDSAQLPSSVSRGPSLPGE